MGGKGSKHAPDNKPDADIVGMAGTPLSNAPKASSLSPQARFFRCKIKDSGERRVLAIDFPSLYLLSVEEHIMATFPIKYLRGYGQMKNVFSFETGRKCPGGVQTYFFVIDNDEDLFVALNEEIANHNKGVAGDRYDHLPAFKKGKSSSSVTSKQSHGSAGSHENYTSLARPGQNTRPASTIENPQEYASLQRGGIGGPPGAGIGEYAEANHGASPARPPPRGGYEQASRSSSVEATYNTLAGRTAGAGAPSPSPDGYSHFAGRDAPPAGETYAQLSSRGAAVGGDGYSHFAGRSPPPIQEGSYSTLSHNAAAPAEANYSTLDGADDPAQYDSWNSSAPRYDRTDAPRSGYEQAHPSGARGGGNANQYDRTEGPRGGQQSSYARSPASSGYEQASAAQFYDKF